MSFRVFTKVISFLCLAVILSSLFINFSWTGSPGFYIQDSQGKAFTSVNQTIPFSFNYKGIPFNPTQWAKLSGSATEQTYRSPDGALLLTAQITTLADFESAKWVLHFRNDSTQNSGVIDQLKSGHIQIIADAGSTLTNPYTVNYQTGTLGENSQDGHDRLSDFTPVKNAPPRNTTLILKSSNGRSSSGTMPYFNIEAPGGKSGIILAVGWSGQWQSSFTVDDSGTNMRFQAGQETFSAQLRPGESFRTPSILLMPWLGVNKYSGYNKFRQLMLKHFTPRNSKSQIPDAVAAFGPSVIGISWDKLTSQDLVTTISQVSKMGLSLNTFWQDAGWYSLIKPEQDQSLYNALTANGNNMLWVSGAGDWTPDPARFPKGYQEVSVAAQKSGYKSLLWFEPERMSDPSANFKKFNDGRLFQSIFPDGSVEKKLFGLVNFADGNVVKQMVDIIGEQIRAGKLDIYRQDMNGDGPLPFWRLNDVNQSKNMGGIQRSGITEASYIAGLYSFWDQLRTRFPDLIIDNCAGGGRRADFEALSRTILLWRSDRVWDTIEQQDQMLGLSLWLPLQGRGTDQYSSVNELSGVEAIKYKIRSGYGWTSSYSFQWLNLDPEVKKLLVRETGWLFGKASSFGANYPLSEIFKGDFYPLPYTEQNTPTQFFPGSVPSYAKNDQVWTGWQLDRPDLKIGFIQAFRRSSGASETYRLFFQELNPEATYAIYDMDDDRPVRFVTGKTLMNTGTELKCSAVCSRLITYEDVTSANWISKTMPAILDYLFN